MILDDLETVLHSHTIEEVWTLLVDRMCDHGFCRMIYGFTGFRTANSFGDPLDMIVLSNHCPEFMDQFMSNGYYSQAPMVRWAADNVGACSWRWMQDRQAAGQLSREEAEIMAFNHRHGIRAGYSISFKDVSIRAKGAIGLAVPEHVSQDEVDGLWREHGQAIEVLCTAAHLRMTTLPFAGANRVLTDRQREVLEWVGDGKTIQDIATIMGLTAATVEKHLRRARDTLDVETTAQAVLKASIQNQIFIFKP